MASFDSRKLSGKKGDDFDERLSNQVDQILNKKFVDEKREEQPFIGVWQEKKKRKTKKKSH